MVIQRSWKILSDTGSVTSASSTEANRSPTGLLNSSSDDSNCSNQTTHSMVTSVASPPGNNTTNIKNLELSHSNIITINNGSTSEMIKFLTTPQIAENTLQKLRQRYGCCPCNNNTTSNESAMRSLELVRIAIQSSFDQEIDDLIKKFIENYFKPAFKNIKENLGQSAVNEDAFQKMSCALLENAKSQYKVCKSKYQALNATTNGHVGQQQGNALRIGVKRPAANKSILTTSEMPKRFLTNNMIIQQPTQQQQLQHSMHQYQTLEQIIDVTSAPTAMTTINATTTTSNTLVVYSNINHLNNATTVTATIATATDATTAVTVQPARRQIYWNTAHISTSTKFVLDVQANQAFGFASDGKERLASKHPELIRYLPDTEDRDWLVSQQIIPQQNRTSRFLFLIYDEVHRLYQTHDIYRNKSNVDLSLMMTFTLADFIIQKMKIFFVDLNIKSRGLITNSYSIIGSNNSNNNNSNNNSSKNVNNGNTNNTNSTTTSIQSNSHLRNALLQGAQSTSTTHITSIQNSSTIDHNVSIRNTNNAHNNNNNNAVADSTVSHKPKSSALSSSHATLTALLNNSTNHVDKSSVSTTNNFNQSSNQLNRK